MRNVVRVVALNMCTPRVSGTCRMSAASTLRMSAAGIIQLLVTNMNKTM